MACILLWSSAVRVHDSQAYRKMDVTRERISRILELREILLSIRLTFSRNLKQNKAHKLVRFALVISNRMHNVWTKFRNPKNNNNSISNLNKNGLYNITDNFDCFTRYVQRTHPEAPLNNEEFPSWLSNEMTKLAAVSRLF